METVFAAIFQQLKTDFMLPQESNTAEEAQEMTEDTKNLLEEFISGILKVVNRLIGWVDASFGDICSPKKRIHLFGDISLISKTKKWKWKL